MPKGINTATINTNESVAEPVNSAAPADTSVTDNSSVDESGAVTYVSSDESSQTDVLEVMYVTWHLIMTLRISFVCHRAFR